MTATTNDPIFTFVQSTRDTKCTRVRTRHHLIKATFVDDETEDELSHLMSQELYYNLD